MDIIDYKSNLHILITNIFFLLIKRSNWICEAHKHIIKFLFLCMSDSMLKVNTNKSNFGKTHHQRHRNCIQQILLTTATTLILKLEIQESYSLKHKMRQIRAIKSCSPPRIYGSQDKRVNIIHQRRFELLSI